MTKFKSSRNATSKSKITSKHEVYGTVNFLRIGDLPRTIIPYPPALFLKKCEKNRENDNKKLHVAYRSGRVALAIISYASFFILKKIFISIKKWQGPLIANIGFSSHYLRVHEPLGTRFTPLPPIFFFEFKGEGFKGEGYEYLVLWPS